MARGIFGILAALAPLMSPRFIASEDEVKGVKARPGFVTLRTGNMRFSGKPYGAPNPKHANASPRIRARRASKQALRRLAAKRRAQS